MPRYFIILFFGLTCVLVHAQLKSAAAKPEKGIKAIHPNSADHRYDAHRFYLNKKMKIIAHHFRLEV